MAACSIKAMRARVDVSTSLFKETSREERAFIEAEGGEAMEA